jgi:hypothetical protein
MSKGTWALVIGTGAEVGVDTDAEANVGDGSAAGRAGEAVARTANATTIVAAQVNSAARRVWFEI